MDVSVPEVKTPPLTDVDSSNVAQIGYAGGLLYVRFKSKGLPVYRYDNFPAKEYENLMNAESKGAYIAAYVRGKYPTTKVS